MKSEEDNVCVINNVIGYDTAVRGHGITVNPYLGQTCYRDDYSQSNTIMNNKGEMVFPELLFKVINKSVPDIESIEVESYRRNVTINPFDFVGVPSYVINLNVKFDYMSKDIMSPSKLSDKINMSFSMMYSNIKFVKFVVKSITINKRDYDKEFFDIFLKKK